MQEIQDFLSTSHPDEIISILCGLAYIIFTARNLRIGWLFGIVGSALWAYGTYTHYSLFFDAILNIFYVFFGFYGYFSWKTDADGEVISPIREWQWQYHLYYIAAGLLLTFLFYNLVGSLNFIDSKYSILDALTTIFSIGTTFLLIARVHSNWLYWIVIDGIYLYIYIVSGAYFYAALFVVYIILAIYGYYNWRVLRREGG